MIPKSIDLWSVTLIYRKPCINVKIIILKKNKKSKQKIKSCNTPLLYLRYFLTYFMNGSVSNNTHSSLGPIVSVNILGCHKNVQGKGVPTASVSSCRYFFISEFFKLKIDLFLPDNWQNIQIEYLNESKRSKSWSLSIDELLLLILYAFLVLMFLVLTF